MAARLLWNFSFCVPCPNASSIMRYWLRCSLGISGCRSKLFCLPAALFFSQAGTMPFPSGRFSSKLSCCCLTFSDSCPISFFCCSSVSPSLPNSSPCVLFSGCSSVSCSAPFSLWLSMLSFTKVSSLASASRTGSYPCCRIFLNHCPANWFNSFSSLLLWTPFDITL